MSDEDIDPTEAAAMMDGETDSDSFEDSPEDSPDVEAGPTFPGPSGFERLLSTHPAPELSDVENPWNPEEGGPTRIYRGVMKLGDIEGLPAVLDIVIGVVETVHNQNDSSDDPDLDSDGDGIKDSPEDRPEPDHPDGDEAASISGVLE